MRISVSALRRIALAGPLVGLAILATSCSTTSGLTPVNFGTAATYGTESGATSGHGPWAVALADVNGDGRPDIITANHSTHSISVLLNTGNGTFPKSGVPTYDSGTSTFPADVVTADLNGDGYPDVITANDNPTGTVSVFLNKGNGTFAPAVQYATNSHYPVYVAAVDVNGDGSPDIVVANGGSSNSVTVLLNHGDGTFPTSGAPTYAAGTGVIPNSIAVADVNHDGSPDIVVGDYASGIGASVLTNDGSGAFTWTGKLYGAGKGAAWFATLADVNGDGRPDIVMADHDSPGTASVLLNTGNAFGSATTYALGGGTSPVAAVVADMNGDGKPDIVSANGGSADVSVLLNQGQGTFATSGVPTFATGTGTAPRWVAVADLNGDGKPDIVTANSTTANVSVLLAR